jgi:enamine deaminase RidA (YjgF/YER057c/UK114 family)
MAGDRRELRPETIARRAGHDRHAVAGGGLVFVAGQLPIAPEGRRLNEASFET